MRKYKNVGNNIFKVVIIGTTSSGKSTLANALLGEDIIPSSSIACTRTITEISSVKAKNFSAVAYNEKGDEIIKIQYLTNKIMEKLNFNEDVHKIEAEGDIPLANSGNVKLTLVDTPADWNDNLDKYIHNAINDDSNSLILCVLNGLQIERMDGAPFLYYVAAQMRKNGGKSRNRVLFLLNKIDMLDPEFESVEDCVRLAKEYLGLYGIQNPEIFPCSALLALNIRKYFKEINIEDLTKNEEKKLSQKARDCLFDIEMFNEFEVMHLEKYSVLKKDIKHKLTQNLKQSIEKGDIKQQALIHSGICSIEEAIIDFIKNDKKEEDFNSTERQELISRDFFSKGIDVDTSKVFPMMVIATMSSGKSTLINALLGKELLPNRNEACTAKIYSILDDDTSEKTKLYITLNDGHVSVVENNLGQALEDANNMNAVRDILISGQIKGILNTDKALLIIDTPGPNNSRDTSHGSITNEVLGKLNGGLIVYVINATQMGIEDDSNLVNILKEYLEKNKDIKPLFVINKVDEIDTEKESVFELIYETKKYIENKGIKNPDIIPISALGASLFKKVLAGENLTKKQYKDFLKLYDLFKPTDYCLSSYAVIKDIPNKFDRITVRGEEYTVASLMAAIENTGITYLEKYIQEAQILSSKSSVAEINLRNI